MCAANVGLFVYLNSTGCARFAREVDCPIGALLRYASGRNLGAAVETRWGGSCASRPTAVPWQTRPAENPTLQTQGRHVCKHVPVDEEVERRTSRVSQRGGLGISIGEGPNMPRTGQPVATRDLSPAAAVQARMGDLSDHAPNACESLSRGWYRPETCCRSTGPRSRRQSRCLYCRRPRQKTSSC